MSHEVKHKEAVEYAIKNMGVISADKAFNQVQCNTIVGIVEQFLYWYGQKYNQ